MPSEQIILYVTVAAAACVMALIATPVVMRIARAAGLTDKPGTRKVHTAVVPRIGGVVILLAMVVVVVPLIYLPTPMRDQMLLAVEPTAGQGVAPQVQPVELLALVATSAFIFLVGLWDDARGLPARLKLLAQIAAATVVGIAGVRFDHLRIDGWGVNWEFLYLSWPLTILWIVGVTNAVNLIDGLDGLAAGISAIACAVIAAFAIYTGQLVMAVLMLTLLGALLGFLVFNFNPARIFLGDCGSMFLGYFLATASVMCATKSYTLIGLALPVVALGVPIFDTAFTMMRRTLDRRSMTGADRGHIHHRIIDMGLKHRQAVLLIYAVTVLAAAGGIALMLLRHNVFAIVVFIAALVPLVVMFRIFGAVRLRETLEAMQRKAAIDREARDHQAGFEEMQLRLREAKGFDEWWRVLRRACRALKLARLTLTLHQSGAADKTLQWATGETVPDDQIVRVQMPPREGPDGWTMQADAEMLLGGSLESAGRRAGLLGRLLDEHGTPRAGRTEPDEDSVPERSTET